MSRIAGLNDLKKKEEDPEEKKKNEFFIGGIDQRGGGSGLAVEGPPPNRRPAGAPGGDPMESYLQRALDSIIQRAQQNSESYDPEAASAGGDSIQITLYRNGFTINDGPFRDATAPENREFLAYLERGEVPPEIVADRKAKGQSMKTLDVKLADKRGEDYIAPPPPAYIAFSGPAATLGSPTSPSTGAVFSADAVRSINITGVSGASAAGGVNMQLRTHDNKKLKLRVSGTASVDQLAAVIVAEANLPAGSRFTLTAGFPPKELLGGSSTVNDNSLANAAIILKLV